MKEINELRRQLSRSIVNILRYNENEQNPTMNPMEETEIQAEQNENENNPISRNSTHSLPPSLVIQSAIEEVESSLVNGM